jgi:hAT family C-terminal dimerisation region
LEEARASAFEDRFLSPFVKGYLGSPAASSSSESVFSVAGDVVSSHRSRLSGEHGRQETLVSRNLHLFEDEHELVAACVRRYLFLEKK